MTDLHDAYIPVLAMGRSFGDWFSGKLEVKPVCVYTWECGVLCVSVSLCVCVCVGGGGGLCTQ